MVIATLRFSPVGAAMTSSVVAVDNVEWFAAGFFRGALFRQKIPFRPIYTSPVHIWLQTFVHVTDVEDLPGQFLEAGQICILAPMPQMHPGNFVRSYLVKLPPVDYSGVSERFGDLCSEIENKKNPTVI